MLPDGCDTVDLGIARIDEAEFALELGFANIVENGAADRAMARTGPDQRDGMRRKQIFQTIGRHRSLVPGRSRPLVNTGIPRNVFLARHDNPAPSRPDDKSGLVFRIFGSQLIVETDQNRHRHRMRVYFRFHRIIRGSSAMPVNIGTIDQYVRIVLGLALIAYAFQDGVAIRDGTGSGCSGWCRS